ncbi:MAG: arsenate reductase ArsC [Desulfosoma sp.]|uniref:arsenate reductase ArsC n=1 Tax=Desulfosoma sp. TaxID=2603217 RepID=UPI00404A8C85
MATRKRILFLCTGNSCRSQMAEAWTRALKGDVYEPYSAGVDPKGLDPRAVKAMAEVGIDIRGQRSKSLDELPVQDFAHVVTLCSHAQESCPFFPASVQRLHVPFDDPPLLAAGAATEEEAMAPYRRVRDEIKAFIEKLML